MHFIFSITIYYFLDVVWTQSPNETQIENAMKEILENSVAGPDASHDLGSTSKTLWSNNPVTRVFSTDSSGWSRPVPYRTPHSLTKLSKTLQKDFDPYFKKSDFEFERRKRPITLVAIRKRGLTDKKVIYKTSPDFRSGEVAQLQSPFNDVGTLWQEELNA